MWVDPATAKLMLNRSMKSSMRPKVSTQMKSLMLWSVRCSHLAQNGGTGTPDGAGGGRSSLSHHEVL